RRNAPCAGCYRSHRLRPSHPAERWQPHGKRNRHRRAWRIRGQAMGLHGGATAAANHRRWRTHSAYRHTRTHGAAMKSLLRGVLQIAVGLGFCGNLSLTYATDGFANAPAPEPKTHIAEAYGKLPLHFEPNAGQLPEAVKFSARGRGYQLFLTGTET